MTDNTTPTPHVWTPETRVAFLESLAASGMVRHACMAVGMSREAAYKLRNRRDGLAFRLGWDAALLIARTAIADDLMERAIDGQEDVIAWDEDRRTRTRRRHDNRLSLSLLGRLDRFAEGEHELHRPAQCIARDWDAYLDLVREGAGDAAILDFLTPAPDVLEACQPPAPEATDTPDSSAIDETIPRLAFRAEDYSVWWSGPDGCFKTNFAPPIGFKGYEQGSFGDYEYERHCTEDEAAVEQMRHEIEVEEARLYVERARRAWFGMEDEGDLEVEGNEADVEAAPIRGIGDCPRLGTVPFNEVRDSPQAGTVPFAPPHDCIT